LKQASTQNRSIDSDQNASTRDHWLSSAEPDREFAFGISTVSDEIDG